MHMIRAAVKGYSNYRLIWFDLIKDDYIYNNKVTQRYSNCTLIWYDLIKVDYLYNKYSNWVVL